MTHSIFFRHTNTVPLKKKQTEESIKMDLEKLKFQTDAVTDTFVYSATVLLVHAKLFPRRSECSVMFILLI